MGRAQSETNLQADVTGTGLAALWAPQSSREAQRIGVIDDRFPFGNLRVVAQPPQRGVRNLQNYHTNVIRHVEAEGQSQPRPCAEDIEKQPRSRYDKP